VKADVKNKGDNSAQPRWVW